MSALTKVFVVLLVIGSLLLTASVVVFVSRLEETHQANLGLQNELNSARSQAQSAAAQLAALDATHKQTINQLNQQTQAAAQAEQRLRTEIANKDKELADLQSQITQAGANVTRLTEALQASQTTQGHLQERVAEESRQREELLRIRSELSGTINDLSNRLEVTERERRNLQEQLTQARANNERFTGLLRDAGIDPREVGQPVSPAQPIAGQVRDVRQIAGNEYATISVGSADGVRPRMEFQVVDTQGGRFLGVLVIDRVEAHESFGRLQRAPGVAQIRPGHEVRTQL